MPIRVVLADDSKIVRRCIRDLLSDYPEIAVVGEAANFAEVLQMARDLGPLVIVLDLHMPDEGTIKPQELKLRLNHGSQVLAMSFANNEDAKELAQSLGAVALLDKMELAATLVPAIMHLGRERSAAA